MVGCCVMVIAILHYSCAGFQTHFQVHVARCWQVARELMVIRRLSGVKLDACHFDKVLLWELAGSKSDTRREDDPVMGCYSCIGNLLGGAKCSLERARSLAKAKAECVGLEKVSTSESHYWNTVLRRNVAVSRDCFLLHVLPEQLLSLLLLLRQSQCGDFDGVSEWCVW